MRPLCHNCILVLDSPSCGTRDFRSTWMNPITSNSYDESPYPRVAYFLTRPTRLQSIAALHGLETAPPEGCRVLEIGCATGGNLLPLAYQYPDSSFLGIDYSKTQIELAKEGVQTLGLKNIEFKHLNILDITVDLGKFDYIIVHGVFSWIPPEIQNKLLQVCTENLDKNGVAYISYNTKPGWHLNTWIRDAMRFGSSPEAGQEQLNQARNFLNIVVESPFLQPDLKNSLKSTINELNSKDSTYLSHEYLEDFNSPIYFTEFMDQIKKHGLQYLGDANKNLVVQDDDSPISQAIRPVIKEYERQEQFLDFIHNRAFRQSLICHQSLTLDRVGLINKLEKMHVLSFLKSGPVNRDSAGRTVTLYSGPGANGIPISDPGLSAGLSFLEESYPQPVQVRDLWNRISNSQQPDGEAGFSGNLLQLWRMGLVELQSTPDRIPINLSEKPSISAVARYLSRFGNSITCLNHTPVGIPEHFRRFLPFIDGSRDIRELAAKALETQAVTVDPGLNAEGRQRSAVASMQHFLTWCSRNALLDA